MSKCLLYQVVVGQAIALIGSHLLILYKVIWIFALICHLAELMQYLYVFDLAIIEPQNRIYIYFI